MMKTMWMAIEDSDLSNEKLEEVVNHFLSLYGEDLDGIKEEQVGECIYEWFMYSADMFGLDKSDEDAYFIIEKTILERL